LLEKVILSIQGVKAEFLQANDGIDLLIYDIGQDVENDFEQIHFIMGRNKTAALFLTSTNPDPAVLMQAIRIGAKEFFPQPLDADELREAVKRLNLKTSRRRGEVCTVMGCKGGVGTTCVAVNFAVALKRLQQSASVALVDLNLVFGEIPLFLNFKPRYTWGELAQNINRMDDVFLSENLFEHSTGIHVLPSPGMWKGTDDVTPQIFMRILSHMRRLFDFIVIDVGHSFSDMNMKTLENSNHVFLVSLLNLPCLTNTSKLLGSFEDWGYPAPKNTHIIINRYLQNSEITLEDCEQSINKKIAWKFPNDYALTMSAINQGHSLCEVDEKAALTKSFLGFAQELVPSDAGQTVGEKVFFRKLPILNALFRGAHS
jgi:pilus assembly protein CpaE